MDYILNASVFALLVTPLVALALWTSNERQWGPAALFISLLALDDLATILPLAFDALDVVGGRWNWEGKVLSAAWAVLFLALGSVSFREAGVTLHQRNGSVRPAVLATLALTAASFGIGVAFGGGSFRAETLAFQLTMPGLAEELVYRGVFIALLHQALYTDPSTRTNDAGRRWPVVITAVAFGAWHGLSVDAGQVGFDALAASFPFIGGLAYGWLRERTGSLLFPVLAHNAGNTDAFLGSLTG